MAWIQLKIAVNKKQVQSLTNFLELNQALSITYMDSEESPIFEPKPGETKLWEKSLVIALFDAQTDLLPIIEQLKNENIMPENFSYRFEQLEDKDWLRAWMDDFHPMQFGTRLWICPSWHQVPNPDAVTVMLDPGLAFGTGTHPTTQLCLRYLDGLDLSGKTVIDFGCGSGILAIAALKLGATQAIGIDIDPQAISATLANAQNNGVSDRLTLYLPSQLPNNLQADLLIANILSGPLKELYPSITSLVKPQGYLGLSGILTSQYQSVVDRYAPSFHLDQVIEHDEWCLITARKH